MTLYYYNDFESGLGDIDVYQVYSPTGSWGDAIYDDGSAVVSIGSNPVYKGTHVLEARILYETIRPAFRCAEVKKVVSGMSEVYFGRAYYIPSGWDILSPGWCNIGQIQSSFETRLFCYLDFDGNNTFALYNDFGAGGKLGGPWQIPRDRWFTVVYYVRPGVNGKVKMWLDGVLVVDVDRDFSSAGNDYGCDAGIYAGGIPANAHLFVDEFRIASTLTEATPVPGPTTQHNLSVTSNPSGLPFTLRKTA